MELGYFDEAAHILTDLLVNIFNEAKKQLYSTIWQFAQLIYERFLRLLDLLEKGEWTCDAKNSWAVRMIPVFANIVSDSNSVVQNYDV
jgi:hypothetical protein